MPEEQKKWGFPPFHATLVSIVVLLQTIQAGFKVYQTNLFRSQEIIENYVSPAIIRYLIISGIFWTVIGLILLTGVILRWKITPRMIEISALMYSAYFWIDFWIIRQAEIYRGNWPFLLVINIVLIFYTFWGLSRPKSQLYFRQNH